MNKEIKIPVDKYGNRVNYLVNTEDEFVSISEYEKILVSKILKDVKTFGIASVAYKYGLDISEF